MFPFLNSNIDMDNTTDQTNREITKEEHSSQISTTTTTDSNSSSENENKYDPPALLQLTVSPEYTKLMTKIKEAIQMED